MNANRIKELLCVVVLIVFIIFLTGNSSISKATGKEVLKAVNAEIKISEQEDIKKCDNQKIKKEFGFTHNDFDISPTTPPIPLWRSVSFLSSN